MATAHRQTGTTKSNGHKIVIPDYSSAWSAYAEATHLEDLGVLHAEGWKTPDDLAEIMGVAKNVASERARRDARLESKLVNIYLKGSRREVRVFRPKFSACKEL